MRIVHVAPLHRRDDTRILLKECRTLCEAGHQVTLVVADGHGDQTVDSIRFVDVGARTGGKLSTWVYPLWRSMWRVRHLRPEVVHFHDGLFLPFAICLALMGHQVVYDVHEDYPKQVLKASFATPVKWLWSHGYRVLEAIGSRLFVAIVPATPAIARKFPAEKSVLVQNFPILDELIAADLRSYALRPLKVAYVGGISSIRGIFPVIAALDKLRTSGVELEIAGPASPPSLLDQVAAMPGWDSVHHRPWVNRQEMAKLLGEVRAGLVTYLATPDHLEAQPNKLFEYMAAGLPVIASDFPHWRKIVEEAGCGLLVDPSDAVDIAKAIQWIVNNSDAAEEMGKRGRAAVETNLSWEVEAVKLVKLYAKLG